MKTYHYLEYAKDGSTALVFAIDANDILEADVMAKNAGFNPMQLSCITGLTFVIFNGCTSHYLSKETVTHVKARVDDAGIEVKPEKFYREFPKIYYKIDKTEFKGNSRRDIVEKNERLMRQLIHGNGILQWKTPDGFVSFARDIKSILQAIDEDRNIKKVEI